MTTIVKKRLQAVVALLVCFMVLFAALPAEVFDSVLSGTKVNAEAETYIIFFDVKGQGVNPGNYGTWEGASYIQVKRLSGSNWHNMLEISDSNDPALGNATWGYNTKLYYYEWSSNPGKVQFKYVGGSGNSKNGHTTKLIDFSNGNRYYVVEGSENATTDISVTSKSFRTVGEVQQAQGNKSILVGVKYYNYFYDEQIAYEMAGGTDDPTSLIVTNGQAKNPYTLFNRAIMASDYGGNNTLNHHGSDGSGGNKTSYPVMYLGEFWVGGNAENGGSEVGSNYSSSPNDVSAGKYPRSVGVNNGGSTVTVPNYVDGNTTITNDKLTNFKWGANLASRGPEAAQKYYHMLAQGLVDDTLSMDPTSPNYLVPTINGQRIPYFDEKFLYASTNSDLTTLTNGKDVGHVYTSIFPFYRKDVTFESNDAFSTSSWKDSWINRSGTSWGRSLTVAGTVTYPSTYYTFNSLTDTVSINPDGGATSDPGEGGSSYSSKPYRDCTSWSSLFTALQSGGDDAVFTQSNLDNLAAFYNKAGHNSDNRPMIWDETANNGTGAYTEQNTAQSIWQWAEAIYNYKNGSMFNEDEIALMTIVGMYDTQGVGQGFVKDVDNKNGYFPFNTSADTLKNLQYGFGTRLDIRFNISKDGQVLSTNGTNKVDEIFRFTGDDDVWVFIDGQLVLDMGGGHKNGIGEINFHTCEAAVLYAGDANSTSAWTSSVQGSGDSTTGIKTYGSSTKIGTLLTNIKNEAAGGISEDHTLTMFYMERGKLNSNMSVMFNFKAPDIRDITDPDDDFPSDPSEYPPANTPSTSKLKIREITNIENVNPGLVTPTMKAAENDAFRYTMITNADRSSGSWPPSGILTPTRDTYERDPDLGNDYKTTLSSNTNPSGADETATNSYPYPGSAELLTTHTLILDVSDVNTPDEYWALWNWPSGGNGSYKVGQKIGDKVYAFRLSQASGGGNNATGGIIVFHRNSAYSGSESWGSGTQLGSNLAYNCNNIYKVNSDGSLTSLGSTVRANDWWGDGGYHNFSDVNYIWNSAFTSRTNDVSDYVPTLTNTTTNNGTFTLLYGTSDEESSALFKNQFYNGNTSPATPSMLKVTQSLAARSTLIHDVNNYTSSLRSVSKYYTTQASTVKRNGGVTTAATIDMATLGSTGANVDVPDMDIIISNYINVANVYVRKENLTYQNGSPVNKTSSPEIVDDEYYFKVYLWEVFGELGNNVTDYTKVKYVIDENDANQISMLEGTDSVTETKYGILKVKAGETAKIMGIPEGTICIIDEMHESELFDNSTSEKLWANKYNLNNPSRNPTITTKIMTDQQTEESQNLPQFVQNIASLTPGGTIYAWQVDGARSNPAYKRALYSAKNTVKNPDPGFQAKQITLIVEKIWDTTETLEETTVKFVVQRQAVEDSNGTLSNNESDWTDYNYDSNHADGVVTLTPSDLVGGSNPIKWRKAITTSAPDKPDENHTYYYRIREWGKDDAVFVYKDGGFYSENFKAVYGAGTQESPVTNIGSGNVGDGTASPAISYSYKTVETTSDGQPTPTYTYTLTLQIKNEYRSTTIDPKPLPKTGARGVYAIVTFGAFAITIAGVALLIYRKKLQTVNIYAVKGSEKPKE